MKWAMSDGARVIFDDEGRIVADVRGVFREGVYDQGATERNARLIAAAPELLAELRDRVADCHCQHDSIRHPDGCGVCETGRVLLARVQGEG